MGTSRTYSFVKCLVLVVIALTVVECRRSGGGSRSGGSRPSSSWSSRPSPSRPSYPSPSPSSYSYHPSPSPSSYSYHPSPSYPSPSYPSPSRPSPSYPSYSSPSHTPIGFDRVNPVSSQSGGTSGSRGGAAGPRSYGFSSSSGNSPAGGNPPAIGFKPSVTQGSGTPSHSSNSPSYGFKPSAPQEHVTNTKPLGSTNTGAGHGSSPGGQPPAYGFKPSAPVGPPTNVKPVGHLPPGANYPVQPPPYTPHNPGIPPPAYNPAHNPAGYGPPPAYNPSYNPAGYGHPPSYQSGYGHPAYPQQQYHGAGYQPHYAGSPGGVTNININNINTNNNHHYGGGYGGGFYNGGYSSGSSIGLGWGSCHFNCAPTYHYSDGAFGHGTLGFFLGYSLAKVTTPTYHYHSSFYDGYTPRYDHYEVHHYYHNRDSIPAQSTIQPNSIVGCIGDSGTICPTGTTSLCTNNGAILCVASATTTVPCTEQKQGNCVRSTIPCVKDSADCKLGTNQTVTIPCVSTAKVPGNITYVNNTIVVNQTTIVNNNFNNGTLNDTMSSSNTSSVLSASNSVINGSVPVSNLTDSALATALNISSNNGTIVTSPDSTRRKRDTSSVPVNEFCVTILALPAERKPTQQEILFKQGTSIFSKFLVKALGAS